MKKAFCVVLLLFVLTNTYTVSATEENKPGAAYALLELGSSSEGSIISYFMLQDVMGYRDEAGITHGILFDGIIFTEEKGTDTPEEAEEFLRQLVEGGVFAAVEIVASVLVEDGIVEEGYKYPLYISFPNPSGYFETYDEAKGFCAYFLDTIYSAFSAKSFEHISLEGVYFDTSYSADSSIKGFCEELAGKKGLYTVSASIDGGAVDGDVVCDFREGDERFDTTLGGTYVFLNGVPNGTNTEPLESLIAQGIKVCENRSLQTLIFTFDAYSTVYECAAAAQETVPNDNGRIAYECLNSIIQRDSAALEKARASIVEDDDTAQGKEKESRSVFYSFLALASVVAIAAVYATYRKVKKRGQG